MNLRCPKCRQKYFIPDQKIDRRESFFTCEKCGEKIIVTASEEAWSSFRPLQGEAVSAKDVLDGIFVSFNLKGFLVSFIALFFLSLAGSLFGLITARNLDFVAAHPVAYGMISLLFLLAGLFVYDAHLYLVSLNAHRRFTAGASLVFGDSLGDIGRDLKAVAVVTVALPALLALLLLPVPLLGEGAGITYAAIFSPVLIVLAVLVLFLFSVRGFLYAFLASRGRPLKNAAAGMLLLLRTENVNLLAYSFLTRAVSAVLLAFFSGIWVLCGALLGSYISLSALPQGVRSFPGLFGRGAYSGMTFSLPGEVNLILFVGALVFLCVLAYTVNLRQTLLVASVRIMETTPGRSVGRAVLAGTFAVMAAVVFLSVFFVLKP